MISGQHDEPMCVTLSRFERQCHAVIAAKMASGQFGEAWVGLDDRRHVALVTRGADRRDDQREAA